MRRLRSLVAMLALLVAGSLALLGAGATMAASTGTVPATTGDAKANEAARQRHTQILQAYGRYDDERLQQYVNELGQRIAAKSDRPDLTYTFTVLDTDQVNAVTYSGGYIYIHRGLLAYLGSEAELAAVLGHEIGHVTARHIARSQAGATAANVGATLIGILTGSPDLMNVAGLAGGVLVSGYSREQESEADELGVKFISRAGYEPAAMADSLRNFWNLEQFELQQAREEKRSPNGGGGLLASHPDIDKRIRELQESVSKTSTGTGEHLPANRDGYLASIDGLAFGTSGAQGVVRGSRFYHGGMGVTLAFPSGWTSRQSAEQIDRTRARQRHDDRGQRPADPAQHGAKRVSRPAVAAARRAQPPNRSSSMASVGIAPTCAAPGCRGATRARRRWRSFTTTGWPTSSWARPGLRLNSAPSSRFSSPASRPSAACGTTSTRRPSRSESG